MQRSPCPAFLRRRCRRVLLRGSHVSELRVLVLLDCAGGTRQLGAGPQPQGSTPIGCGVNPPGACDSNDLCPQERADTALGDALEKPLAAPRGRASTDSSGHATHNFPRQCGSCASAGPASGRARIRTDEQGRQRRVLLYASSSEVTVALTRCWAEARCPGSWHLRGTYAG